ncbi:barstar family protein [Kitasatospora purpeofusca]|uniref:barstar family protein n=1 Tax=Kitasatospora purpeofusca TaxID=67352 RepID=UPI00068F26BC|nr:barstar family protein [Kitasatospora purpeofusca]
MVIDVGAVRDDRELHATLQRELGFPSFRVRNGNAFHDAVTGPVVLPAEIRFTGRPALERRAPHSAAALREQPARYREALGRCVVHYQDMPGAPHGPGGGLPGGRGPAGGH